MSAQALHLIAEAEKLAFADRDAFIGDPDFVPAPVGLLNAGYLDTRRGLDRSGRRHGASEPRRAAADGKPQLRRRRDHRGPRHQPLLASSTATATCWP